MALYRWFLENLINPHSVSVRKKFWLKSILKTEQNTMEFKIGEMWDYHMTWTQNPFLP